MRTVRRALPGGSGAPFLALAGLALASLGAAAGGAGDSGPLDPGRALASFQVDAGLEVELAAAEPAVVDPVALAFDAAGRLYVAENRGYPVGPGPEERPAGTIGLLEDLDADGRFESRRDFAAGLTFPNGVLPWKGGVVVTCAPDVLWLADTDGDGRADRRQVLLSGFDDTNTTQLRVSHPTLALDGWIYLTSGLTGTSRVTVPAHPERPAVELRTDSRFDPRSGAFEALEGRAQFGLTFDDFGRRFICMNRVHVQHVVLSVRHLGRNPHLALADTVADCPEEMVDDLLRGENRAARIWPISDNITTADSHAGTFSAACGVLVYRGTALPAEYRGDVFACEPTGNLVHRDRLLPRGPTFTARPARAGVEFLASTDNWFRPVFLASGPDGALYVCDMYRKTIEHPRYLPEAVRKRTDFESGTGMGRVWRVTARWSPEAAGGGRHPSGPPDLAALAPAELVALLGEEEGWVRDTAHRLLLEREDPAAAALLRDLLAGGRPALAAGRACALRLLDSLGGLTEQSLLLALEDRAAGVREVALECAESRARPWPRLAGRVLALARDADPRVRFRAALALGEIEGPEAMRALAGIALGDGEDRWFRTAVLSSLARRARELWEALAPLLAKPGAAPREGILRLLLEVGRLIALETPPEGRRAALRSLLGAGSEGEGLFRLAALAGFAGAVPGGLEALSRADGSGPGEATHEPLRLAARAAPSDELPLAARVAAVRLLGAGGGRGAMPVLLDLVAPGVPLELLRETLESLARLGGEEAPREVLRRWDGLGPEVRSLLVAWFLSCPRLLSPLLEALESGRVEPAALTAAQRESVLRSAGEDLRERAQRLFQAAGGRDRLEVYEEYRSVLFLDPDPAAGRRVFREHCAPCHRLDREGSAVGPDLLGVRDKSREEILFHVLVPNADLVPGFAAWDVVTRDGRVVSGIVAAETESAVKLRQAGGVEETFARASLLSVVPSSLSLMPEGIERSLTRRELADLVAYVRGE